MSENAPLSRLNPSLNPCWCSLLTLTDPQPERHQDVEDDCLDQDDSEDRDGQGHQVHCQICEQRHQRHETGSRTTWEQTEPLRQTEY